MNPHAVILAWAWITAQPELARRRLYDIRARLAMVQQGVAEFATANVKDFQGLGFHRVWNPLEV